MRLFKGFFVTTALSVGLASLAGCGDPSGYAGQSLGTLPTSAKLFTKGGVASILVKSQGQSWASASLADLGVRRAAIGNSLAQLGWQMVSVPVDNVGTALAQLQGNPDVVAAVPNLERHVIRPQRSLSLPSLFNLVAARDSGPNDPDLSKQYAPKLIGALDAWKISTGKQTIVAIVDTGVDIGHPDLKDHVIAGWNTVANSTDDKDDFGHGTHCAGIAAAIANNGIGGVGVAPDAQIMPVKVLGADGSGSDESVAAGITWSADHGATVVSLSLGGSGDSKVLDDAVAYALKKGSSVVAAMGNDGTNEKSFPAAIPGVIAVGASDAKDKIADFSQWGDWISVSAPGVAIYSTLPTYHVPLNDYGYPLNYGALDGTSMATPNVAGEVALVRSANPSLDPGQVKARIEGSADKVSGQADFDPHYGHGRIDVLKAVKG